MTKEQSSGASKMLDTTREAVERFDLDWHNNGMDRHPQGDWVDYDDYAALRRALQRIADMKPHHAGQTPNEYHMQQIALDALDQPKEKDDD